MNGSGNGKLRPASATDDRSRQVDGTITLNTRSQSALDQGGVKGRIARRTVADFATRHELDFGGLFRVADGVAALCGELDDSIRARNPLNPADAG